MKLAPLALAVPILLLAACGDDGVADEAGSPPDGDTTVPVDDDGGGAGEGIVAVRLEATDAIFIEGFEVGMRFDDADSGEEIKRITWSEFVASIEDATVDPYTAVLEQPLPAGTVRIGVDVNIGIGPGPEPPDLDAERLPCELEVDIVEGETIEVEVKFDDSLPDCAVVVE